MAESTGPPTPRAYSPLGILYSVLYAGSIVAYNPFVVLLKPDIDPHYIRGFTWTQPKVVAFAAIVVVNLVALRAYLRSSGVPRAPARAWFQSLGLWGLFLGVGIVSTVLSPLPRQSFTGHSVMGDGLLYWIGMAVFVHSHAYLLMVRPRLARYQMWGIVAGGVVCALAVFPQVIDWRLDYTVTSGRQVSARSVASGIVKGQMPIGLYSHRGNAGFVLAAVCSLLAMCVSGVRGRLKAVVIAGYACTCLALLSGGTRGPILALVVGLVYLVIRHWREPRRRREIVVWGAGMYAVAYLAVNLAMTLDPFHVRQKSMVGESLEKFSSSRTVFFRMAAEAVRRRPLYGWGFDGFGISFYRLVSEGALEDTTGEGGLEPGTRVKVNRFVTKGMDEKGEVSTTYHSETKAHNLVVDLMMSVGLAGTIVYLALLAFSWRATIRGAFAPLGVVGVVYLAYTLTWFECAQFSHLAWWALGAGLALVPDKGGAGRFAGWGPKVYNKTSGTREDSNRDAKAWYYSDGYR